ncbi:MAG TPA: DUF805 domain-containing protein [Rhodothermales bacterium]
MQSDDFPYGSDTAAPVTASDILFSFEGRINRSKYWGYTLLLAVGMMVVAFIGFSFAGEIGLWSSYGLAVLFVVWPALAVSIKRCHDRNRSGWFVLVSLIPIVSIWYLIEVGFLRGTDGPNDYGEDPLT